MFVFITIFKNMVVEFVDGCSIATSSYMITYSVSKVYCFASVCGIMITKVKVTRQKM